MRHTLHCSSTHGLVVSVFLRVSALPSCPPFLYSPPGALLRDTAPISTPCLPPFAFARKGPLCVFVISNELLVTFGLVTFLFIRLLLVPVSNPLRARSFPCFRLRSVNKNSSVPIRIVVGRCLQVTHGIQDGWEEYYRTQIWDKKLAHLNHGTSICVNTCNLTTYNRWFLLFSLFSSSLSSRTQVCGTTTPSSAV